MSITRKELLASKSLLGFLDKEIHDESDIGEEIDYLIQKLKVCEFELNTPIVTEGEIGESMYFIEKGQAAVIKDSEGGKIIGRMTSGYFFGELSLISGGKRAATIRVEEPVTAYELSKVDFDEMIRLYPRMNSMFLTKVYNRLTGSYKQLEINNAELKKSNQMRIELGTMFTNVVLVLSLYTFMMMLIRSEWILGMNLSFNIDYIFQRVMEFTLLIFIVLFIKNSSFTRKDFGLTTEGWKQAVLESLGISAIVIVGLFVLKWASMEYNFDFIGDGQIISMEYVNWSFAFYLPIAFLQELIARGVVQGSIQKLLVGKYAGVWAVTVASFIFALLHTHSSTHVIIAAIMSGFLWGLMYIRHKNLIGITLSHFLIGNFADMIGFWL